MKLHRFVFSFFIRKIIFSSYELRYVRIEKKAQNAFVGIHDQFIQDETPSMCRGGEVGEA